MWKLFETLVILPPHNRGFCMRNTILQEELVKVPPVIDRSGVLPRVRGFRRTQVIFPDFGGVSVNTTTKKNTNIF